MTKQERAARAAEMARLVESGLPYAGIAGMLGVSEKSVQRAAGEVRRAARERRREQIEERRAAVLAAAEKGGSRRAIAAELGIAAELVGDILRGRGAGREARTAASRERDARVAEMHRQGMRHVDIAKALNMPEGSVRRSLRRGGQDAVAERFARLKPKKKKLALGLAQGLSVRDAAVQAGYSEATARSGVRETAGEKRTLAEAVASGVTVELVAQRMREGIDAERVEYFAHQGKVRDEKSRPDLPTRRTYIELYAKLTGALKDVMDVTVPVQVILDL